MSINELKNTLKGEQNIGETLKILGGAAVNVGVDMVVGTALSGYLCPKKGIKRILGSLGILVLSMKVGDVAEEYFSELIDDLKAAFVKAKEEAKDEKGEPAEVKD